MEFDSTKASIMTVTVGVIGLVVNINVAYAVKKCRTFGHAFGTLCLSQTVSNIGNLCVFVFLTGGVTLIDPSWHATYLGRRSGQLLIFFWEASIFTHLFISINRAVAVNFPVKYNTIFSENRTTNVIIGLIWFISLAQAFPYSFPSCSMLFHPDTFTYEYSSSTCGKIAEQIGDLYVSITVVSIIAVLDITSFLRLHQLRVHHTDRKTKSKELRLFFQACTQSVLLMFCECSFFYLSSFSENIWFAFVSTTFIWVVTHCLDGVIVIVFSREIRRIILRTAEVSVIHPSATHYHTTIRQSAVIKSETQIST
ncbi:hypothetical protein QR680_007197 [Steinernema hermaphroditum]|uniref:G-protein coupled receptors family 1 profile domain-containing protein n=1 Tax=Steinernema hermaphroditum TaxID=289476 RepID=A0AA39HZ76_9BILA|nr:hypothetical protein QR680_007197 [Steinernema hermaphroditum]